MTFSLNCADEISCAGEQFLEGVVGSGSLGCGRNDKQTNASAITITSSAGTSVDLGTVVVVGSGRGSVGT